MTDRPGAEVLVRNLEAQGVTHIFGIPGAKIDRVYEALNGSKIELVVCRHEQNAAFIAGGLGRLTGKAGVCLVTSGPGVTNLATGLATATSEGMPMVALGGSVPLADRLKQVHQSLDNAGLMRAVSKYSVEVTSGDAIGEVVANAFRAAEGGRPGAAFISLPQDVMVGAAPDRVLTPAAPPKGGAGDPTAIAEAAAAIDGAKLPVLLLGMLASRPEAAAAVRTLLRSHALPTVCTYQGAGVVPQAHLDCFGGRVGLFHNQPGDRLLDAADVVVAVGFDPIEYDPSLWNGGAGRRIVHIDAMPADFDACYRPAIELVGDIAANVAALAERLRPGGRAADVSLLGDVRRQLEEVRAKGAGLAGVPAHPLRIVHEMQKFVTEDMTVALDMGAFHIWIARYFYSFRPGQLLISNGQQTLGVALPWAIAASLARPHSKTLSVSGDGGFLFSATELETAVRLKCNLVHMIWTDGGYNMVAFQERAKYGRVTGTAFGPIDVVKYAEAFGAKGYRIGHPDELAPTLRKAMETPGPVLIDVPVDYRDNPGLMGGLHPGIIH
ncbi:MAG: acetolactate synthase AlsS [Alphaproteobacteria bacterium]